MAEFHFMQLRARVVYFALMTAAVAAGPAAADGGGAGLRIQLQPGAYDEDEEEVDEEALERYVSRLSQVKYSPTFELRGYFDDSIVARTIDLRSLGDSRTLMLINGRLSRSFDSSTTSRTALHTEIIDSRLAGADSLYLRSPVAGMFNVIARDTRDEEPQYSTALRYSEWGLHAGYKVETESSSSGSLFSSNRNDAFVRYYTPQISIYVPAEESFTASTEAEALAVDEIRFDLDTGYQFPNGTDSVDGVWGTLRLEYKAPDIADSTAASSGTQSENDPPVNQEEIRAFIGVIPDHLLKTQYRLGDITGNPFLHDFSEGAENKSEPPPPRPAASAETARLTINFHF